MQIQILAEIFVCTWWSRLYPAAEATQLGRLYNESLAARWERRPTHLSYFLTTTKSTVLSYHYQLHSTYHYQLHSTFSSFKFCTFVPLQTVFPWEEGPTPLTILFTPTPWLSSPLPASPLPYLTSDQLLTCYRAFYQPSRDLLSSLSSPFILSDMKELESLPPNYQLFAWGWT